MMNHIILCCARVLLSIPRLEDLKVVRQLCKRGKRDLIFGNILRQRNVRQEFTISELELHKARISDFPKDKDSITSSAVGEHSLICFFYIACYSF